MNRRDFLFQLPAGLLLATACARTPLAAPLAGEVFVTGVLNANYVLPKYGEVVPDLGSFLLFFTATGQVRAAPVPFDVHSVTQNPRYPNLLLLVPKRGQSVAIFDVARWAVSDRASLAGTSRRFLGHAVWEASGEHFWLPIENDDRITSMVARWARTLREDDQRSLSNLQAHEIQWSPEGLLVVAGTGGDGTPTGLNWINPETAKVERYVDCGSAAGKLRYVGHFYQLPALGKIFAIGKNDMARDESLALVIDVAGNRIRALEVPEQDRELFKGESLSVNYDEHRREIVVTSIGGKGYVSIWDPKNETFVRSVRGISPRGALQHNGEVFVTQNRGRSIKSPALRELVKDPFEKGNLDRKTWVWGSHVDRLVL